MSISHRAGVLCGLAVAAAAVLCCLLGPRRTVPENYADAGRPAEIDPDYSNCTIPPNIAPLNFVVKETGSDYCLRVYSQRGEGFLVFNSTAGIVFPAKKWKTLLESNPGGELHFDVYVRRTEGRWLRFDTITNRISPERVDSYLVYRRLKPVHNVFRSMGTYQRNLSTYEESPLLPSGRDSGRCVNCHTFTNNDPDTMCLHTRGGKEGAAMLLVKDAKATKINTRTSFNSSPAAYTSWHPNGRLAAFAVIEVVQFHHAAGNSDDVFVHASDLCVYDRDSNGVSSVPQLSDPDRLETFPTWSPDGKYLYFCSAPRLWEKGLIRKRELPLNYRQARYDLMRVGYDDSTGAWGELEPVLLSQDTGLSINEPRISPDGRFLLFCMADYGCFPVFRESSDLYMICLETGRYWRLENINSRYSESWHCWSTNGRWITFASKRRDGLFGRVYLSYVDPHGDARKPVLLPQQDPNFYAAFLENFNVPELIAKPVGIGRAELLRAIEESEASDARFVDAPRASETAARETAPGKPQTDLPPRTSDLETAQREFSRGQASEKASRIEEAVKHYLRSVQSVPEHEPAAIPAAIRLARIYATHPSPEVRNAEEALRLAILARQGVALIARSAPDQRVRRDSQATLPGLMDTLAAAYAENGRFLEAAKTALEAETMALDQGQLELAGEIRDRLDLYFINRPYRTPSPN